MRLPKVSKITYIKKFLKKEKPDIIHCQPLFSPISLIFLTLKNYFSYKIVGSLITGEYSITSFISKIKYITIKLLTEHYIRKKTTYFFVKSEPWKKIILQLFNISPKKIIEIPLGADSDLFKLDLRIRKTMRKELGFSPEEIVIIYSGKIIQTKKLHLLFNAIAPVIKKNSKVKLLIVGRGKQLYLKQLKKIACSLGIAEKIIFHSWVTRRILFKFYNAADIAVWPGSISISIIEAASVGLPVVIKRSPISRYKISNENGLDFKKDNVVELNHCLRQLIMNPRLRERMGQNSRRLVEQKLNWKTIAQQYLESYNSAL